MTDPQELAGALRVILQAFERLAVTWAIGGSVASSAHGEPRSTNDVDVIAVLSESEARAFVALLGADFYADADVAADAARRRSSFNIIDTRGFIKIDVFVPPSGPLGTGQLERRVVLEIFPGLQLPILGPEDVILQKLRWHALGGGVSERQWRDVVAVLRLGAERIDHTYLDQVAASEGLTDGLRRAREDATDSPSP
ncbi:MAG: hypothetical protein JWO86_4431 [Myxococcaceae bacterium]|nr:hypothetical protein [Myxococcaceae bacterium]